MSDWIDIYTFPCYYQIKGTSEYSERGEPRGIFSSDEAKNTGNTLCIPEAFCKI